VIAPGTVISAAGNCIDINKVVEPVLQRDGGSIYYINLSQDDFKLGFFIAQTLNTIGKDAPTIKDAVFSKKAFNTMQLILTINPCRTRHRKWRTDHNPIRNVFADLN
jgi:phosphoribosylformylglycinamidine synthase